MCRPVVIRHTSRVKKPLPPHHGPHNVMDVKRVLGVDPGLNVSGYGLIETGPGRQIRIVEAGVLRGGTARRPLGQRLLAIRNGLQEVIESFAPQVVAMEELYSHYERPRTAILMGHARGALCLASAEQGLPVFHYSATQVKRVLTGNGRAPKTQIQQTVAGMLGLPAVPEPADVADALAIAMCHGFLAEQPTATVIPSTRTAPRSSAS